MREPVVSWRQPDLTVRVSCVFSAAHALTQARERVLVEAVIDGPQEASTVKWHLFLDRPVDVFETCAISCALMTLLAAGESRESPLVERSVETLLKLRTPATGGWTSWVEDPDAPSNRVEETLIIDTFCALQALRAAGRDDVDAFREGIDWFCGAHNGTEGGWGFFGGDSSYVLPTSMALCILGPHAPTRPAARDAVAVACAWLLEIADAATGAWGRRVGSPLSAVHTSWALRGLMAAGVDTHSAGVVDAREWLLDNAAERDYLFDSYVIPGREGGTSRSISHISFADALVPLGALAAGADLLDNRLLTLVERLLLAQEQPDGHWRCHGAPHNAPIFAISDACLTLITFTRLVAAQGESLELREEVAALRTYVDELRTQQHGAAARLQRLDEGLIVLRPLMWLTAVVRGFPVLSVIAVLGFAGPVIADMGSLISLIGGACVSAAALLGIAFQIRPSRERARLKQLRRRRIGGRESGCRRRSY